MKNESQTTQAKAPRIYEPDKKAQAAVIWLHGLGANADDFKNIVPMLPINECRMRLIFPNAPSRKITINNNRTMSAWHDIIDLEFNYTDSIGISASQTMINRLIDEQINAGIKSEKIIIAGFSQGGAMAIYTGLRYSSKLAGILALSSYILDQKNHTKEMQATNLDTPIWIGHGTQDLIVDYSLGQQSSAFLIEQGYTVKFNTYPMEHQLCLAEIQDISYWIKTILS